MRTRLMVVGTLMGSMALTACTTNPTTGQMQPNKALLGGLSGAAAGALLDRHNHGRGAAIGAVLGGGVGIYMDTQERRLRQQMAGTGVEVARNQQTGAVDLIMPGNITFATDSAAIAGNFTGTLSQLASTLSQYDKTTISVRGYTDNTGSVAYNQRLSQDRANSVANFLISSGIPASRIQSVGYGMSNPIADNNTVDGRAKNRRVEISINPPASV